MNLVRFSIGGIVAAGVTLGLFFIMHMMIFMADKTLDEDEGRKIADIFMPEVEISAVKDVKPKKPDDPEEPPPDIPQPEFEEVNLNPDALNMSVPMEGNIDIGMGGIVSDGEYLPIVKVTPIYPRRATTRGIEGYCIIQYTVTKTGSISDPQATDCRPKGIFERASLKAAAKFKYKPRVVDGEPIAVAGVRNKFTYTLEK